MLKTRQSKPQGLRRFIVTFVLFLAGLTLWSVAFPMFGAADENQHMLASYGIVHGQGRGQLDKDTGDQTYLAPSEYPELPPCWGVHPQASAACEQVAYGGREHRVVSRTASYPPYYYALVGWPTLITSGRRSLYLMRFVSAILVALMMSLALDNLVHASHPGPLVLGLAVALVPLAYFFGASVNPSGLAIASSLAAWTGGILLLRGEPVREASSVARFAGPLCVLLLLRRDSLYWAALLVLALLALTTASRARQLARSRAVWVGIGAVGLSALISLASGGGTAATAGSGQVGSFWSSVSSLPVLLQQLIGDLGWGYTFLPYPVIILVQAMVAFLAVGAWFFGPRRLAAVTAGIAAAIIMVPVAIGTIRTGYFMARYEVGFAAGLPLVAALAIGEQLDALGLQWPRRAQAIGLTTIALVQVMAFAQMLRDFSAGVTGQWWIFTTPEWTPPYASLTVLALLFVAATTALYAWLFLQSRDEVDVERHLDLGGLSP